MPAAAAEPSPGVRPGRRAVLPAYSIADLRARARRVLPRGLFEYVDRGTEDEVALHAMRAAIDQVKFQPRVLVDVSSRSTATDFFGRPSSMPMAIAPTGAAGLLWFDGEIALARAARSAGIPFILSTASIVSMERVAAEAGGRLWFQLYMWPERQLSLELVERARQCNYEALVVTLDTPAAPNREYNKRNGFSLPMRISRRNALDVALHPRWFLTVFARYMLRSGVPSLENYPASLRQRLDRFHTPPKCDSLSWDDLKDLRRRWKGPLLVKGILRADDACKARECGVDAVVVSNHGGRNLDSSVAPMQVLPRIVDQVGREFDVFVDGGFNRGGDIAKALALGAKGVLVGRAPLWGLAAGGEPGAAQALDILREEFDRVLAFAGAPGIAALDRSLLFSDDRP
ncbi:alpha-hydroxy-acid oxidizing protein [Ramlibacter sp. AW1]|uniref:Alpha-hydroxy-acid oxidizing protein n=2 Tax=Ramlibacter aurantiacus TaxID=2801330 RepID=A0A936ZQQ6_9BURK|nr:alpha-hydroxy-acid oxidizing protein [Ramlibacter aurantiacus]